MLRTFRFILYKRWKPKISWNRFIAVFLLTLFLVTGSLPALSQSSSRNSSVQALLNQDIWLDLQLLFKTTIGQSQETQGNLKEGWVFLDGLPLFRVSAPNLPQDPNKSEGISQLKWRINEIEHNLAEIVDEENFNPEYIDVEVKQLNNQFVVLAGGDSWEIQLLTITDNDWQADDSTQSIEELADKRADIIQAAFSRAFQERQPNNLRQEILNVLRILPILLGISLIISLGSRLINFLFNRFEDKQNLFLDSLKQHKQQTKIDKQFSIEYLPNEIPAESEPEIDTSDESNRLQNVTFRLAQIKILRKFLKVFLFGMQMFLWLGGITWILFLFYNTRRIGRIFLSLPFSIILIITVVSFLKYTLDILFSYGLRRWINGQLSSEEYFQRFLLRLPTVNAAFFDSTYFLALVIGILWFLKIYDFPLVATFASIGLLGFAFQNLIQDLIQGVLILWEDQYTQGDFVKIGGHFGEVEQFSLRATQIRTLDGEVITIGHSSFDQVINYTKNWSRLNLGITVAYNTDLDKAIKVIEAVAFELLQDPQWQSKILEQPKMLGVDDFGDNSITIRLLIKTKPKKQWEVGREYRRRLKIAFDRSGISIPFPQRSIWFENPLKSYPVEKEFNLKKEQ